MRKIAFITDKIYPYFVGGQEKRIFEYSKILRDSDQFDILVVSMKWWQNSASFVKNINYIDICPKLQIYKKNGKRNILSSIRFGVSTFFYVLKSDNDILDIEIFPYFPVLFARSAIFFKKKKPVVVGYWAEYWGKEHWREYYKSFWVFGILLEKLSFLACDQIIANSHFTQDKIQEAFGKNKKSIVIIPPVSIDIDEINKVPDNNKEYDIIYYGRIIEHKHVEHVVNVVEKIVNTNHNFKALIIGNGPDEERIKKQIISKSLSKNIIIIDFVREYKNLIKYIKSTKIMIQPSEREGFGITVVEANACGLPVLTINYANNAAKELIEDNVNGFICDNFDDVVIRVQKMVKNNYQKQLHILSNNSKYISKKYNRGVLEQKIIQYYKTI